MIRVLSCSKGKEDKEKRRSLAFEQIQTKNKQTFS